MQTHMLGLRFFENIVLCMLKSLLDPAKVWTRRSDFIPTDCSPPLCAHLALLRRGRYGRQASVAMKVQKGLPTNPVCSCVMALGTQGELPFPTQAFHAKL